MNQSQSPTNAHFFGQSNVDVHNSTIFNVAGGVRFVHGSVPGIFHTQGTLENGIARQAIHYNDHRIKDLDYHRGTRQGVISNIVSWVENRERFEDILWVKGTLGVGKSTVARAVADKFYLKEANGRLAGSFFFCGEDSSRNHPGNFALTVAYQLAATLPAVGERMNVAISRDPAILHGGLNHQWMELVVKPVRATSSSRMRAVIIIDGLDECGTPDEQQQILSLVFSCGPLFPIAFVITSRPESHLQAVFDDPNHRMWINVVELEPSREEMKQFLVSSFATIKRTNQALSSSEQPWPPRKDIDTLIDRACGQYLYLSAILNFVSSDKWEGNPRTKLQQVIDKTAPIAAFIPLDDVYHSILEKCSETNSRLTYQILFQITYFPNAIYIHHLSALFNVSDVDIHHSLRGLRSVVGIDPTDRVRIPHRSFIDFLLDNCRSGSYALDHATCIADVAIQYLTRMPEIWNTPQFLSPSYPIGSCPTQSWRIFSERWLRTMEACLSLNSIPHTVIEALEKFPFALWLSQYASQPDSFAELYERFHIQIMGLGNSQLQTIYHSTALDDARRERYLELSSGNISFGSICLQCMHYIPDNIVGAGTWSTLKYFVELFLRLHWNKEPSNPVIQAHTYIPDMWMFDLEYNDVFNTVDPSFFSSPARAGQFYVRVIQTKFIDRLFPLAVYGLVGRNAPSLLHMHDSERDEYVASALTIIETTNLSQHMNSNEEDLVRYYIDGLRKHWVPVDTSRNYWPDSAEVKAGQNLFKAAALGSAVGIALRLMRTMR
ncbi:hypothetical protein AX16_005786 [Volvariella volvacea WC 439]|nr:hypothetical protein AX16_005786 [Volvariella volvacea WC 439]